jgi:sugar phosphate isomerase/epimerase
MMELGVTAVMLPELDFDEQISLLQKLKVKYYQYRPRIIPESERGKPFGNPWGNHKFDLTPQRFVKEGAQLTRKLRDAGLEPWGTVSACGTANPDDELKLHLDGAAAAGVKSLRFTAPPQPGGDKVFDYEDYLKRSEDRIGEIIAKHSAPRGLRLIIETHCGSMATSPGVAYNLCKPHSPKHIGVIFDIANFAYEGELRPTLAVSVLRDYIDCCHVGGSRRAEAGVDEFGCRKLKSSFCPLEQSDLHIPSWIKALHEAKISPPLIIEDFESGMSGSARLGRSAQLLHRILQSLPA